MGERITLTNFTNAFHTPHLEDIIGAYRQTIKQQKKFRSPIPSQYFPNEKYTKIFYMISYKYDKGGTSIASLPKEVQEPRTSL